MAFNLRNEQLIREIAAKKFSNTVRQQLFIMNSLCYLFQDKNYFAFSSSSADVSVRTCVRVII